MLKRILEGRKRAIAWEYIKQANKRNNAHYPQLVCYSFDHIAQYINFDGRYEARELDFITSSFKSSIQGKTVLDIGANIGNHTVAFAEKAGQVFAFEPHPRNFQLLAINACNYANVKVFNVGASNRKQTLDAVSPSGNMGGSAIVPNARVHMPESQITSFSLVALDELSDLTGKEIGFVKIDVEGHELAALTGMKGILNNCHPLIALEQHADEISDGSSPVMSFLMDAGYQYFYELSKPSVWRTPESLPKILRLPMKVIENFLLGPKEDIPELISVLQLEKRSYFMLFASAHPLRSPEASAIN